MFKIKKILLPSYNNQRIEIILTDDDKSVFKKFGKYLDHDMFAEVLATDHGLVVLFNLLHFAPDEFSPGIMAHEALHIINYMYEYLKIDHEITNDEATAYLLLYLTNELWEAMQCQKKSKT